ncbi:MAG TPA: right-handed parallel beta-helix repeat-containing protein [Alphaproteobacteria bacterium]|nr:right-handed parallel beta-helix repeat-containing protein [Alphaproteobacteria bacterium]
MTVYYVDAPLGDSGNAGRSETTAWRSADRVNEASLSPGDVVLFRRGQVWRDRLELRRPGEEGRPITIGAYGDGPNPLFSGADVLTDGEWRSDGGAVWSLELRDEPGQLFLGDRPGVRVAGRSEVSEVGRWSWHDGVLTVYAEARPPDAYGPIEACMRDQGAIWNDGVDFIRYQDLRVARAKVVGLRVAASEGIEILGVEVFQNGEDGVRLTDGATRCLIRGGSSHHNGVATDQPSGHGYVFVQDASRILVEDVECFANAQDGLQMGETCGSHNTVRRVFSHDNGYSGFNVKSGSGHTIRFVHSLRNGKYGLMSQFNLIDLEVTDSRFEYNSRAGSYANLKIENDVALASRRNLWGPIGGEGALAHSDGPGVRASFESDVFHDDGDSRLFVIFWGEAGTELAFRQCTFQAAHGNGLMWFEEGVGALTLANSILAHDGGRMIRYHRDTRAAIDHNLYHRPKEDGTLVQIDGGGEATFTAAMVVSGGLRDHAGTDAGSIVGDPLFLDRAAGDLSLRPDSPAVGAGDPAVAVLADHRRAPFGTRRDIGAFAHLDGAGIALGGALCGPAERPDGLAFDAGVRSVAELVRLTAS